MKDFIIKYWLEVIFGLVFAVFGGLIKKLKTKYDSLQTGMCALLRDKLIQNGEKYLEQGWIPIYAKEAYDKSYEAYHGLGGNGTMTELHKRIMELPDFKPKEEDSK